MDHPQLGRWITYVRVYLELCYNIAFAPWQHEWRPQIWSETIQAPNAATAERQKAVDVESLFGIIVSSLTFIVEMQMLFEAKVNVVLSFKWSHRPFQMW